MRVIGFLTLCVAAVLAVSADTQRIMGGSFATIDQYPTIASLLYTWNTATYWQTCGGTIINNRSILTAASCTNRDAASRWRVRVGSSLANSGGVVHNVASIINHPNYNSGTHDNDIGVLRTATTIAHNDNVRPASIAGPNYNLGDNQVVWAAGWGRNAQSGDFSEHLRHVQIWTVNQNTCTQRYATVGMVITPNMLCSGWLDVGGRDQCYGDCGGPLYHNGVVVGVFSFNYGCGRPLYPGVNSRVSSHADWIQSNA